jgi:MFS family permease
VRVRVTDAPTTANSRAILATRGMRAVGDGLLSASLSPLLIARGFNGRTIGLITTATLLGSAVNLILVSRFAHVLRPRRVLLAMSVLMAVTGFVFASTGVLAVLLLIAVIGPLNPSSGDVSPFLSAEQTIVGSAYEGSARTRALARFALVASAGASAGAFLAGPIAHLGRSLGFSATNGIAFAPFVYGAIGIAVIPIYLTSMRVHTSIAVSKPGRLGPSRPIIVRLTAVFALDSAGGGMVVNTIIALWLKRRFDFSLGRIGVVLGLMSLASAASALLAPKLSARFGLVETMALTHAPANVLVIAAAFAPNPQLAVACLGVRALLSQLDVPPRVAFVMSLVTPEERSAASAFTNLPRSIATASTPLLGGWLLTKSTFGWPLVIGGVMKLAYDALLWTKFRRHSQRL